MHFNWRHVALVFLLLLFGRFSGVVQAQGELSEAENVAKMYVTAFFHGDMETAANLTLQETLDTFRQTFVQELDKAQSEGRLHEFLAETGLESDPNALRKMNSHDLFVVVVGSNQKRGKSSALQAMKRTIVDVEGSKKLNENEASVRFKIVIPAETGPINQSGGLLLVRQDKTWRVKSNLP
jgi:hypothetical protein